MKRNKIIIGDCSEVLAGFPAECIDLTVTSPPYDSLRDYEGYIFDFEAIAKQLYRVTKKGGVVVWVVEDQTINGARSCTSYRQLLFFVDLGFSLYEDMVYKKNTSGFPPSSHYENVTEKMFVLSKGKPKAINIIKDKKNKWAGTSNFGERTNRQKDGSLKKRGKSVVAKFGIRQNIWEYSTGKAYSTKDNFAFEHPAIFPEALARDHIISWSNKGDLILDPMCGSGTTLKMAKETGREFIGIDTSDKYVAIANKRVAKALVPLFLESDTMPNKCVKSDSANAQAELGL